MQLSRQINLAAAALSTGTQAVEVDTKDCEGVMFVAVPCSTAVRLWSLALKAGATTTGFVNSASTHTHASTAANNNVLVTDVYKPAKRYLGATLSSSTATPSFLLAFKYGVRKMSTTFSATANLPVATPVKRVVSPSSAT